MQWNPTPRHVSASRPWHRRSWGSNYEFVEFLIWAGQKIWQVLPLGPMGYGDSPYQLFSAFACNPLLIDLKSLRERGLLSLQDLTSASGLRQDRVEYRRVIEVKHALLGKAGRAFLTDRARTGRDSFDIVCEQSAGWLDDYTLFMACKSTYKDAVSADWDVGDLPSLKEWREKLAP